MIVKGNSTSTGALQDKTTSYIFSHTNDGEKLVLSIQCRGVGVTGVTYGGVSMGVPIASQARNDYFTYLFELNSPKMGANDVVISFTGTNTELSASAISLLEADAGVGFNAKDETTASSGTPTNDVTSTLDDCIIIDSVWHDSSSAISVGAGQTQIHNDNFVGTGYNGQAGCSYEYKATAGAVNMAWSGASADWAGCAAAFVGGGSTPKIMLV